MREERENRKKAEIHPHNRLNDLDGAAWLFFTKSVISTAYNSTYGHKLRRRHGANKPPQLMRELIEFFTKPGESILDPFAGVGGTLIGASICRPLRRAIGIEINPEWLDIYHRVCEQEELVEQETICDDCRIAMAAMPDESFDFIATDPPYSIHLPKTMCHRNFEWATRRSDYNMRSEEEGDLANLKSYSDFLKAMSEMLAHCRRLLRCGRYMALIVRNSYQDGRYIMVHADLAARAAEAGLILKGEKVWYQAGSKLRPYGYPHVYVPNIAHQHILILRRED